MNDHTLRCSKQFLGLWKTSIVSWQTNVLFSDESRRKQDLQDADDVVHDALLAHELKAALIACFADLANTRANSDERDRCRRLAENKLDDAVAAMKAALYNLDNGLIDGAMCALRAGIHRANAGLEEDRLFDRCGLCGAEVGAEDDSCLSCGAVRTRLRDYYWRDEDKFRLARFYRVHTKDELIEAQAKHIEKLQAARQPLRDTQPGRVREG